MKDIIKGIAIGIIATLLIGISGATVYYILNRIIVHEVIINKHGDALTQILRLPQKPPEPTKKRR